jgi:hypothetical protein
MRPEEIEDMLHHRALRSKARPVMAKRLSNIALGRAVAATAVAGTALLCTLAMTVNDSQPNTIRPNAAKSSRPLMTDTNDNANPSFTQPNQVDNTDPITASLAMSR